MREEAIFLAVAWGREPKLMFSDKGNCSGNNHTIDITDAIDIINDFFLCEADIVDGISLLFCDYKSTLNIWVKEAKQRREFAKKQNFTF